MNNGSIGYYDGSSKLQELAAASDTDVLTLSGGVPSWATAGEAHTAGQISMWAGDYDGVPTGWLLCDGSSVSTTTYAALYGKTGVKFGNSGGAGTFDLPNLTSKIACGIPATTNPGGTGGANSLTLSESQMPDHTHTVSDPGHDHPQWTYGGGSGPVGAGTSPSGAKNTSAIDTQTATTGITISNTGGSTSFDNRPAYLELCFIIKT
jgi:microcystin-dependent protein